MRFPGPTDLLKVAGQGYEAAERAIALVPRVVVILGQVEKMLVQVTAMIAELEPTAGRAAALVTRTDGIVSRAEKVLGRTESLTDSLVPLVERFQPTLDRLEPMAARLADTTSPHEVDAVVMLVNTLPEISEKVRADILPILDTLGTVAPDLRDLLDVSKELNEMLGSVPGMGRVKKRIEDRQEDEDADRADEYLADETPPSAPDRRR
jgi:hypothetical protein